MHGIRRARRTLAMVALASALAACGGGGDGASSSAGVGSTGGVVTIGGDAMPSAVFSVPSLRATGATNARQQVEFDVTVRNPPAGTPQATVRADKPGIVAVDTVVSAQADGSFHVVLVVDSTLAPGGYTGNLGFMLCTDSSCAMTAPVSDGLLLFAITVLPDPLVSVTVDGAVPVPTSGGLLPVHVGDTATITTGIPLSTRPADASDGWVVLGSTATSLTIRFTAQSASPTPFVPFYTAGGASMVGFQFTN